MGCISSPIYSKYAWSWSPVICTGVDQLLMLGMETTHLYLGILIMSIKNVCWWPSLPYEWEFRPQHIWPSCYLNGGDLYDKVLSNHDLLLSKKKSVDFVLSCYPYLQTWFYGIKVIQNSRGKYHFRQKKVQGIPGCRYSWWGISKLWLGYHLDVPLEVRINGL